MLVHGVIHPLEILVRQRNPGPHMLVVPTIPAELHAGDVVDWPDPITGLQPVDDAGEAAVEPTPDLGAAAEPPPAGRRGGKTKTTGPDTDDTKEA